MHPGPPSRSQPYVIVIAGPVGSGKSTVSAALARTLGDVPLLIFDHYGPFVEWPQDMAHWIQSGADPGPIRIPRLKEDPLSLREGKAITDPYNGRVSLPSRFIILEEPAGRERDEIREFIDLVVYIDVPADIVVQRPLGMDLWHAKGTFASEPGEQLARQLDTVAL
jgi:uridine kinase